MFRSTTVLAEHPPTWPLAWRDWGQRLLFLVDWVLTPSAIVLPRCFVSEELISVQCSGMRSVPPVSFSYVAASMASVSFKALQVVKGGVSPIRPLPQLNCP